MDNTKKINRWLSQILHCYEQTNAIITQAEQAPSAAILAHCHERLEFFAAREQVLQRRMRRLERQLEQEVAEASKRLAGPSSNLAEASKKLLDTIYDAVRQRGKVTLTKKNDGGVRIEIPPAEKKKSS
jgi:hypothetical protein